jgi:hypothetical protein
MQISITTMESSMEIPRKAKDITAIWSSDTVPYTLRNLSQDTIETPCTVCVHHSTIHNSQAMETTQMPYNWWMD